MAENLARAPHPNSNLRGCLVGQSFSRSEKRGEDRSVGVDYSFGKPQRGSQEIHAEHGIYEIRVIFFISICYVYAVRAISLDSISGTSIAYLSNHRGYIDSNSNFN
jgi:hypothetical protein